MNNLCAHEFYAIVQAVLIQVSDLCSHLEVRVTADFSFYWRTMPYAPKKPCKYPGCNKLTAGVYCLEHARIINARYNHEHRDPEINARYQNDEWRQIREEYIVAFPFCQMCRKYGKLVRAEEVHHIKPLAEGGTNNFSNLISLCHRCHAKVHAERGDGLNKKKVYTYENT